MLGGTGGVGGPGLASLGPGLPSAAPRVKRNSESERRSPSSEDERDERESRAEIRNAEDYNEIFQPRNSISEPRLPRLRAPACPSVTWRQTALAGGRVHVTLLAQLLTCTGPGSVPRSSRPQQEAQQPATRRPASPEQRKAHRGKWAGRGRPRGSWDWHRDTGLQLQAWERPSIPPYPDRPCVPGHPSPGGSERSPGLANMSPQTPSPLQVGHHPEEVSPSQHPQRMVSQEAEPSTPGSQAPQFSPSSRHWP